MTAYRADIDGLRAVAVLAVVLFHAGVPGFSGGYVGVDVFFVISGFLITGIIRREFETGCFSIISFYDRRIRRIMPAFFAVLFFCFFASVLILFPHDLKEFGGSARAASLFVSNLFFKKADEYFDNDADEKPLLHTWSLSVEEQFYIIWPLILVVLLGKTPRRLIAPILIIMLGASLGAAQWQAVFKPKAAFYLAPLRAWELIMGAALALGLLPDCRSRLWRNGLALLGLGLVVFSVATFDASTTFPGLNALFPCIGAALILHSGRPGDTMIAGALGWRPVAFIGLVSYSLYLWHWPVLVFARHAIGRDLTLAEALAAAAASFLLSILSWRYVEQPFRSRAPVRVRFPVSLRAAGALIAGFAVAGSSMAAGEGMRFRFSPEVLAALDAEQSMNPLRDDCRSTDSTVPPAWKCMSGRNEAAGRYSAVLWGDSHADAYFPGIARIGEQKGFAVRQISKSGCPPLTGVLRVDATERKALPCRKFNDAVIKEIVQKADIKLVILSARWVKYTGTSPLPGDPDEITYLLDEEGQSRSQENSRRVLSQALERTVDRLVEAGKEVLILGQVPEFGFDPPTCIARSRMGNLGRRCEINTEAITERYNYVNGVINKIDARHVAVHTFFPHVHLCDERVCLAEIGDQVLYRDNNHLSVEGALHLSSFLAPPLLDILLKSDEREANRLSGNGNISLR